MTSPARSSLAFPEEDLRRPGGEDAPAVPRLHQLEADDLAVERDRALHVVDIERGLEQVVDGGHGVSGLGGRAVVFESSAFLLR
jgi:hypothetical protein